MSSPMFSHQASVATRQAWIGSACLLVILSLVTLVLSPVVAGDQNTLAVSTLPVVSRTGEGYWFFLPTIHGHGHKEVVDQGDIWDVPDDFASTTVAAETIHRWEIFLFANEVVGITAIAAGPTDIVLSLTQNGQPVIDRQNDSPTGEAEIMITPDIATDGAYEILVETADRSAAEYAVAAYLPGVFEINFKGFLAPGDPQQDIYLPFESTDLWFFTADANDLITMELTPDDSSDIVGLLFGPEAEFLEQIDFGFGGEVEHLADFPLLESGLHAVSVLDLDNDAPGMVYDIVLDW